MQDRVWRMVVGLLSVSGLLTFFLLQHFDFSAYIFQTSSAISKFLINRSIRFLINDFLAVLLIYALFEQRKYVIFALWVQAAGFVFLLLPYFALKLYYPTYNGPLINFLHRIILNPTLIMLLIPAFYYQKRLTKN
jgi:exosortase F-associated protein